MCRNYTRGSRNIKKVTESGGRLKRNMAKRVSWTSLVIAQEYVTFFNPRDQNNQESVTYFNPRD